MNGLTVGDPTGRADAPFVFFPRLTVELRWLPLLRGRLVLPLVWAERPRMNLTIAGPRGGTWRNARAGAPEIDHLVISQGAISLVDRPYRSRFVGVLTANERRGLAAGPNDSVIAGALVIDSPPWAGPRPLLDAPGLMVRLRLLPSIGGEPVIRLVSLDQPRIYLAREASGQVNWRFSSVREGQELHVPPIGRLMLSRGALSYRDARLKLDFLGSVSTDEAVGEAGRGRFVLQGRGSLRRTPFTTRVSGGALVNIDMRRAYPLNALVTTGGTRVSFVGMLNHPFDPRRLVGRLRASGPDLADLYPLTGVALPITPPYALSAGFSRDGSRYVLTQLAGRVGVSDLTGTLLVDDAAGRPFLKADLRSRRLNLADLTAVVGGVPKHPAGRALSPIQRAMSAQLATEHRILPDVHLDVARIRTTDANVDYRATRVDAGRFPIKALALKLALDHGRLTVDPLTMTLPQGDLTGRARLDAAGPVPVEAVDVKLANARLENLVGRGGASPPIEGGLFASARLRARGDSVRAAAASADGEIQASVANGEMRQTLAELLGIDATKALLLLITKNQGKTPVRCAAADFRAQAGILTARRLVLDTGVVLASGTGDIDLRKEALNLQLQGKPKKFRLVRIGAPITVKGTLAAPKFGVDVGKAAGQLTISALLGAVVAPLSALLPFVSPGAAKDADCAEIVRGDGLGAVPAERG